MIKKTSTRAHNVRFMMTMVLLPRVTVMIMMMMTKIQMIETAVIESISRVMTKGSRCAFSSHLLQICSSHIKHRHRQIPIVIYIELGNVMRHRTILKIFYMALQGLKK